MLLPNAKRTNLKVSVSPILDLWNRFRKSLGHEFIGKKATPSRDSGGRPHYTNNSQKKVRSPDDSDTST